MKSRGTWIKLRQIDGGQLWQMAAAVGTSRSRISKFPDISARKKDTEAFAALKSNLGRYKKPNIMVQPFS